MKAMLCGCLCGCRRRLEAADDEELLYSVLAHLREDHTVGTLSEAQVREVVASHSYEFEEVAVVDAYAEEEFGIDPY